MKLQKKQLKHPGWGAELQQTNNRNPSQHSTSAVVSCQELQGPPISEKESNITKDDEVVKDSSECSTADTTSLPVDEVIKQQPPKDNCDKQCLLKPEDKRHEWDFDTAHAMILELASVDSDNIEHRKCTRKIVTDIIRSNDFDPMELDDVRELAKKKLGVNKAALDKVAKAAAKERGESNDELPPQSHVAEALLPKFKDKWRYSTVKGRWYKYNVTGLWKSEEIEAYNYSVKSSVDVYANIKECGYAAGYLRGIQDLLKIELTEKASRHSTHYIPFKNGILRTKDNKFFDHRAEYHITWQLDFNHDPNAVCPFSLKWLKERLESDVRVELVRAVIAAILLGLVELQFFVELHGAAGAGKSVFQWLLEQLVGSANTGTTDLKVLENNRFEAAGLVDKRLIIISDSKEWAGEAATLKAITGNDPIRIEQKNVKTTGEGCRFPGIVVVAANQPIQVTDHSNAISRRRVPMHWENPIRDSERRDDIHGDLQKELPGIVNWALELKDDEIAAIIKKNKGDGKSVDARLGLLLTNRLAAWLHDQTLYAPGKRTNIGNATDSLCHEKNWLYPSYAKHLEDDSKSNKPLSVTKFSESLHVLLTETLKLTECYRRNRSRDGRQFEGLVLRESGEAGPSPIDIAFDSLGEQSEHDTTKLF